MGRSYDDGGTLVEKIRRNGRRHRGIQAREKKQPATKNFAILSNRTANIFASHRELQWRKDTPDQELSAKKQHRGNYLPDCD
jgi:hypothetical protein